MSTENHLHLLLFLLQPLDVTTKFSSASMAEIRARILLMIYMMLSKQKAFSPTWTTMSSSVDTIFQRAFKSSTKIYVFIEYFHNTN